MADKESKKVKTEESAYDTIVGETSADIKEQDDATTDVNVTETVNVPEEEAEAAKPKPVAKDNRRGSKALRDENAKLKERAKDAEEKYKRLLAECENIRQRNEKEAGMEKIYRGFLTYLESVGVTPMNCEGEQFDPTFHNAVMHVEDESLGENVILEEMQKGYMYKDQVLRYSMVKVAN